MRTVFQRLTIALVVACAALVGAAPASAEITSVFGGAIPCSAQEGVRFCGGTATRVASFDGLKIDVNVALPAAPASGADGPYPLVAVFHGWGGRKEAFAALKPWAQKGYAVFTMSDRGWGDTCSKPSATFLSDPDCPLKGWNRLMDTRYEVRDAQELIARLADEDVVVPDKVGAYGPSYGGGISLALATLRNRRMNLDGTLGPWKSPGGKDMAIAAAVPGMTWSDLAYSLMPNGRTLDYVADAPYRGRIGVMKQTFVTGLFATGAATSYFAPPGMSPDLNAWYSAISAGEPYDGNPLVPGILSEITRYHSSYYIDHSQPPAPLLLANGWADDLFPVDESLRFYNRLRTEFPSSPISLLFFDYGHQRAQNKSADVAHLDAAREAWFGHYLKGQGSAPANDVTAYTVPCGGASAGGGPYSASSWAALTPGEVRIGDASAKTVSAPSDPQRSRAYDPIVGGGACATAPGSDQAGTASYRRAAPAGGVTLLGSPTIVADINSAGPNSQVAARLLDVDDATGNATLIARGLYRPDVNPAGAGATRQVFQLHPGGWRFEPGHTIKLELLTGDAPYARASNGQAPFTVSNLELRLPVRESPNGGDIQAPAAKVVPSGYELAADYRAAGGDADGDGVPDGADRCPNAAGPASSDGCPTVGADRDRDGITDGQDRCPDTVGVASNGGCPAPANPPPPAKPPPPPPPPPASTARPPFCGTVSRAAGRLRLRVRSVRPASNARRVRRNARVYVSVCAPERLSKLTFTLRTLRGRLVGAATLSALRWNRTASLRLPRRFFAGRYRLAISGRNANGRAARVTAVVRLR